ncbi:MAG: YdiU family protein [Verrucomicrobiaceae bacterium]|nr:YdiU family protein [Verrucomicrobiaceae bacterium]
MTDAPGWRLEHSYSRLPELFFTEVEPTPVREPHLVIFNQPLAAELGLPEDEAAVYAGNTLPPGARPIAQAYAGHQYAHFTGLGDGRAILLGEQITPDGARFDIQLKGPGPTPYSRRGDGRAALGPMLREYVISEAMHALGIPTTRSLAVATTGEKVWRQDGGLPGGVLTRVAASHIRVGTFEWAAAHRDVEALKALAEHTRQRHYPEVENNAVALYEAILERQAALIAKWMLVGFVHGVMNTDNMALSGETIDYGPCAFMDAYDPATVFSSIDRNGRYAYGNQPLIAQWNLARLAEAMLPLFHEDEKQAVEMANGLIPKFEERFKHHWLAGMRAKLGLFTEEAEDGALIQDLFNWMKETNADFTNTFAALAISRIEPNEWHVRWQERLSRQPQGREEVAQFMRRHNPAFIPRNHKVEEALTAANEGDLEPLHALLDVVTRPWEHGRELPAFRDAGPAGAGYQTFCGT